MYVPRDKKSETDQIKTIKLEQIYELNKYINYKQTHQFFDKSSISF